jgi:hypothetical protein
MYKATVNKIKLARGIIVKSIKLSDMKLSYYSPKEIDDKAKELAELWSFQRLAEVSKATR